MRAAFRLYTSASSHGNVSYNGSITDNILQNWHPKLVVNIITYVKHLKKYLKCFIFLP
jgi:hypothetical protein